MKLFSWDIFKSKKENYQITQKQFQDALNLYEEMTAKTEYIQSKLKTRGFYKGEIDGLWGPLTNKAVKDFQRARNLKVDGIVGPVTLKALNTLQVQNFKDYEFKCRCNGRFCNGLPPKGVEKQFLLMLEEVRKLNKDRPIIIRSGYRCPEWNRRRGGARHSQHMSSPLWCADILSPGVSPREMERYCLEVFENHGIGLGGRTIVHVDRRPNRARWYY